MRSPKSAHGLVDMFQQKDKAFKKRKYEPNKQDEVDSESFYFEIPEGSQLGDSNIFGNGEKAKFNIELSLTDDSLRNQTTETTCCFRLSQPPIRYECNRRYDSNTVGGGRLNDNAVLQSLLWELGKAGREMAVLDSFEFLSPSWSIRKIQHFKETYTATKRFLIPIGSLKRHKTQLMQFCSLSLYRIELEFIKEAPQQRYFQL
jgi:hypothetical protein